MQPCARSVHPVHATCTGLYGPKQNDILWFSNDLSRTFVEVAGVNLKIEISSFHFSFSFSKHKIACYWVSSILKITP